MAQDFRAAFGLGEDERHINTVDADGVALATIQGLNHKMDQEDRALRKELQAKDSRISALEKELATLKELS